MHLQLLGGERRFHLQPAPVGQAQRVGVEAPRAEGGGEQHRRTRAGEARGEEGRRDHVAQAKARGRPLARTPRQQAAVDQRMRAEAFRQAAEVQGVEIGELPVAVEAGGLLGEVFGDRADQLLQGADQLERQLRQHRVGGDLLAVHLRPGAQGAFQRLLQRHRGLGLERLEAALVEFGAVHAAAAVEQVVRLVHQQADAPVVGLGQAVQLRTSEHRSMYSYVRLSIDRCTATYV